MRRIKQPNKHTCGVACIAMLASVSFSQARKILDEMGVERRYTPRGGRAQIGEVTDKEIAAALKKLGRKPATRLSSVGHARTGAAALASWLAAHPILHDKNALLKVNPHEDGAWHAVVWDARRRKILEPLDDKPPGNRRYRLQSYLVVE